MLPRDSDPTLHDGQPDAEKQSPADGQSRSKGSNGAKASQEITAKSYDKEFEVSWDGDSDPTHPQNFTLWRKWSQVLITSSTSLCVTCTSSLYTSTYDQITVEFGCSRIVATLGLSLFVAGLGLSPMILGPFSEFFGRKPIYIISMFAFIVWIIPCAVAQNIQTMLVSRFISGLAGSAFLTVAGGTVSDLFTKKDLQVPMAVFTASPFMGPIVGPVLGGFINQFTNWRWSFWTLLIWSFVQWILILLLVPETFHPVLLRNKARKLRKETGDERWHAPIEKMDRSISQTVLRSLYRPFLLLALEPMCLNLCLLSALLLGILYLFFGAFELVFSNNYGFSLWQVGLSFLGMGVGMALAVASSGMWHKNYLRLIEQHEARGGEPGTSEPEYRLPPAVMGAPLVTIGLFWFAWTTVPSVHWIVPIIGSAFFGMGTILVFSGVFTFLVDAYPLYAASALAANSLVRSSFAAAFPLFGVTMYDNLGYQWATSLLAFLSLAMAPFPYIFYKYGKRIRRRSRFATAK